jgi:phosphatidate cytidylyltransferase
VSGADPARQQRSFGSRGSELALRVASALVLVPLAIAMAYLGGWPFAVFWGAAALGVFWEWTALVTGADRRAVLLVGGVSVALSLLLVVAGYRLAAATVLAIGTVGTGALAPSGRRGWAAAGVPYAGALAIAPVALRSDRDDGFFAIILLFAIVWATDIVAYFAGRAIGGPKLMPLVSPKKTWSGAIGGTVAALVVALAVAKIASSFAGGGSAGWLAIAVLAVILSVIAQAGDLFESFLKRRFGAKDSSHLIPGHGGLMDRLDGFVTASAVAALIGLLRGGFEAPGRGLLVW